MMHDLDFSFTVTDPGEEDQEFLEEMHITPEAISDTRVAHLKWTDLMSLVAAKDRAEASNKALQRVLWIAFTWTTVATVATICLMVDKGAR